MQNYVIPFIKIHGYGISRFIRNLIGRKRCHAVAMYTRRTKYLIERFEFFQTCNVD